MNDELKPVRCGCGGEAIVDQTDGYNEYNVYCPKCFMSSGTFNTEAEAIEAWNKAMGNRMELQTVERMAKVIEHDASVTDTDGYKYKRTEYLCSACKKRVIGGDDYCSHCGAKLIWIDEEDIPIEYFENGGI